MASSLRQYLLGLPDYEDPSSRSSPLLSLYADLAARRASNRASFEASVAWWKDVLFGACFQGAQLVGPSSTNSGNDSDSKGTGSSADRLVLHMGPKLLEDVSLDEVGRPLGLGTVVEELRVSLHLHNLNSYLKSQTPVRGPVGSSPSASYTSRVAGTLGSLATRPLSWAFSQLTLSLGFSTDGSEEAGRQEWKRAQGDWVIWDNVDALADAVIAAHRASPRLSPLESLFSTSSFRRSLLPKALESLNVASSRGVSELDFRVLLKHLSRDRSLAVVQSDVVKLEHEEGVPPSAISEHERGIVHVRETHARLEEQVAEIESRIKERQSKVEASLRANNKEQALSYLRSRKALEALLQRRVNSLETLHGVLVKIEQAAGDVEIVKAYDLSTASLKTLLADERLQVDKVEGTMDNMQEALADADEVRQAVEVGQQGMRNAAGVEDIDEDEMNEELARLEEENKREEEEERKRLEEEARRRKKEEEEAALQRRKAEEEKEKRRKEEEAQQKEKERSEKAQKERERESREQQGLVGEQSEADKQPQTAD